ncbi:uncharacterized protein SPSC_04735 [Sporisorium scitamineum]|uniref:Velvet domain-containing protein n=1 Tax=Sporisorium scitamineum TaxID=49012 RepID=A0A0F7S5C5_9BASI|nr:uncharacterized protein SPSC_04735 [Sporisorium scitamineum]CDW93731.1 hypothetical protein [Sporisorium scitamineum]
MASTSSSPSYKLILVQEPTTGSAFEDNLLGRIGLAPPLILELQVTKDGKIEDASAELPFLICQCSLLNEHGAVADMVDREAATASSSSTLMPPTPKRSRRGRRSSSNLRGTSPSGISTRSTGSTDASSSTATTTPASGSQAGPSSSTPSSGQGSPQLARMLYGTIVAGPQQFHSLEDVEKPYFFFPEISVRTPGKFKIQCRLMRLALPGISPSQTGILASVETQTFQVVKRNDYMAPYITDVSRHFARQGVPLLLPPGVSAE